MKLSATTPSVAPVPKIFSLICNCSKASADYCVVLGELYSKLDYNLFIRRNSETKISSISGLWYLKRQLLASS